MIFFLVILKSDWSAQFGHQLLGLLKMGTPFNSNLESYHFFTAAGLSVCGVGPELFGMVIEGIFFQWANMCHVGDQNILRIRKGGLEVFSPNKGGLNFIIYVRVCSFTEGQNCSPHVRGASPDITNRRSHLPVKYDSSCQSNSVLPP